MLHRPSERLAEIDRAFDDALDLDPDRRDAFLASMARRDPRLAADVERLLRASDDHDPQIDFSRWVAQAWRTLAAAKSDAPEPTIPEGTHFGPYRLVREIARGGMATVYLAERDDGAFEQQVALKVLPLAYADREAQQRLHRERRILARLQHSSICRLLDGGADQWGRPFLVMELVDGAAIDAYCHANRLAIDQRIRLVVAVAQAVAFAHRSLIVHGDLKPSNILVTAQGRVTLLDFGIARLLDPGEVEGTTARRLMTPGWASPEQLRGDPLSTASDVFQLGLLLRMLLVGRPADDAGGGSGRLRGDLNTIVSKALEADPAARYHSATALADDLERHLDGRPILARAQTLPYRTSRFVRRHRVGAAVGALAAVAVTAGALTAAYQSVVAGRERAAAQHAAAQAARVSDFLVEVFEVSAPERALGSAITARELLDRGVQRIDQLDAEPALKASLLQTMGRAYRSHGIYDRAAALFERTLIDRRAATPTDPNAIAAALHDLGTVRHYQTDFTGASALFDEALALRQESGDPSDSNLAETLHQRGRVRLAMGDHQRAEEDLRRALDMLRLRGNRDPSVASVLVDLGQLLGHGRRAAEATPLLEEAVTIRRTAMGSRHPAYSESLMALGTNLDARGRGTEGTRLVREAAEIAKAVYGSDHPATLNRENSLASRLYNQGEYDEALTLFRRIHDTSRTRLGDRNPLLGIYGYNLGATYYDLRRFEEAERALRHALGIYEATRRPQSPETLNTIRLLANTVAGMGRHREAESLFERGLAASRQATTAADAAVAALRLGYGRLLIETGRHERAAPLVEAGYASVRARSGESSWLTAAAKATVGRLRQAQHKSDEATALWAEALDVLIRDRPNHPVTAEVRDLLDRARR
jgi:eukaryotic-like serine/threonine-protein kinase